MKHCASTSRRHCWTGVVWHSRAQGCRLVNQQCQHLSNGKQWTGIIWHSRAEGCEFEIPAGALHHPPITRMRCKPYSSKAAMALTAMSFHTQ